MFLHAHRPILNNSNFWRIFSNRDKYRRFSNNAEKQSLQQIVENRKLEAARSIVVQVAKQNSFNNVYNHCSQFGQILNSFYYSVSNDKNFILLEFDSSHSMNEALRSSSFPLNGGIPVKSQFLWFRNSPQKTELQQIDQMSKLNITNAIVQPNNDDLVKALNGADSISQQMELFYEKTCLNDLSIRLRYLGVKQIESVLCSFFLDPVVWPFGSTVNGFGKLGSDLDMILQYNRDIDSMEKATNYINSRLMFHVKSSEYESESDVKRRETLQRHIRVFGAICENFLTGIINVNKIYSARVPIVRYSQNYLNLSVDVSLLNMSGFYVSELFHIFGELDERVKPLVFVAQRWAKEIQLTRKKPGALTNFHITCLVLSFLQKLPEPILPTVKQLVSKARDIDVRQTNDNEIYTFLRDLNQIDFQTCNSSSLEELFMQFLEFYGRFNFKNHLISLSSTDVIPKIENSGLQIMNPFVIEQNWGRNVTSDECAEIKYEAQHTLGELLDAMEVTNRNVHRWGLLDILHHLK